MRYKALSLVLIMVITLVIAATAILTYSYEENKTETNISLLTGFAAYTTKVCDEDPDSILCYEQTYVECNGEKIELPQKSNYVVQEKIYLPRQCGETEIILKQACGYEKKSPSDWIKKEKIKTYTDRITVNIDRPYTREILDTNSMDPLIDETATIIEIPVSSEDMLAAGDIIAYRSEELEYPVIHRIADTGRDEKGTYFILRGDNNNIEDGEKVRFSQIEGVIVGILY